ncbi:MAG: dihydrofolate reductase family protein [Candidatus Devosia phytovorans]|uniref:Dihydrofolate reductase family protein n=1 Tax=Candidatus Devosia phytovorans TaxID=3121372 RepID=A0AAJ5VST6_9HYPH|nr:dihydrofolate reductase family protein [Devosia sp.]WEK02734.1 MAG: dihydrofolate reductase family protein [Devosia sp.]
MRELILKMSMSLDGFVSDMEGRNAWMFGGDEEAKAWSVENVANASLHIMGSRSFEAMAPFWPVSTTLFAPPMNQIPKAVFSRRGAAILKAAELPADATLQPGGESWAQSHVASGDLAGEITRLKSETGKPILAHGGYSFAQSLVASGLVDQFVFAIHPIALGQGHSPFSRLEAPLPLTLVSSRTFPGGAMAQVYRPTGR